MTKCAISVHLCASRGTKRCVPSFLPSPHASRQVLCALEACQAARANTQSSMAAAPAVYTHNGIKCFNTRASKASSLSSIQEKGYSPVMDAKLKTLPSQRVGGCVSRH